MGILWSMDVFVFGAGASAAEGAPPTQEFLSTAWNVFSPPFEPRVQSVWRFLETVFQVSLKGPESFAFIPGVDEVVSLVDWSLHVNQGLGPYDPPMLYQVRRDLEHLLCATLDAALNQRSPRSDSPHAQFVTHMLQHQSPTSFALISLNYDTLLDDALVAAGIEPDYGFRRLGGAAGLSQGPLLAKLHGSLNWALCPACGYIAVADQEVAHLLPHVEGLDCPRCGNRRLQGLIISPTWLKDYEGVLLHQIWDLALECIQQARRIVFVGYSMPPADVAIYHLFRRGMLSRGRRPMPQIEVINHHRAGASSEEKALGEKAVIGRFSRLFGPGVRFDFSGFRGQTQALPPSE